MEKIYIPTFKRVDNQITFNELPDKYKEKTILVVQDQEREQYKYDCEYFVVGNDIGIAKTRELIYRKAGNKRYAILDDDIIFYRRNKKYHGFEPSMEKSKRVSTEKDIDDMMKTYNEWMNEGHMHIGCRDESLWPKISYLHNKEIIANHFIDGNELFKFIDDVDWDVCQIGEDHLFTIECMRRGYMNRVSDEFLQNRWSSAYDEGGCAEYRTAKYHDDEMMKLAQKYPEFVTLKKMREVKKIGIIRHFQIDWDSVYKSYQTTSLSNFLL